MTHPDITEYKKTIDSAEQTLIGKVAVKLDEFLVSTGFCYHHYKSSSCFFTQSGQSCQRLVKLLDTELYDLLEFCVSRNNSIGSLMGSHINKLDDHCNLVWLIRDCDSNTVRKMTAAESSVDPYDCGENIGPYTAELANRILEDPNLWQHLN